MDKNLKAFIDRGGIAEMPPVMGRVFRPVTLRRLGEVYEMRGPLGTHRLAVPYTDAERLSAHWHGFQATARNHIRG